MKETEAGEIATLGDNIYVATKNRIIKYFEEKRGEVSLESNISKIERLNNNAMITLNDKSELVVLDANLKIISLIPYNCERWRISYIAVFNNHVVYLKNASEIDTFEMKRDNFFSFFE